jgi:hypothetical protein
MTTKSIPELLQQSLQHHRDHADIKDDAELDSIINKLSELSEKVAAAKAKALARRNQK